MTNIEILEKLIECNTINDKENIKIVNFISNYLEKLNFKIEQVTDKRGNINLIASFGSDYTLGFLGHMDTVTLSDNWTVNPFKLTVSEGKLYGLGVCDMKSGIAAFLSAVSEIDYSKLKKGIKLYFTTAEEIDFEGIKSIVSNKEAFPPRMIIAEPSDLVPITRTKGILTYKIEVKGISTHGSTPDIGENAIEKACLFIKDLQKLSKKLKIYNTSDFNPSYSTMNIGTIKGGTMENIVPDSCTLEVEFRTTNDYISGLIENKIKRLTKKYNSNSTEIMKISPMFCKNQKFISSIEKLTTESIGVGYVTEASLIDSNSIIIGPGPISAHEKDEYISLNSYKKTIELYKKIIEDNCY